MHDVLNKDEIEQLKSFRFSTKESFSELSIPINVLLDDSAMNMYLEKVGSYIGSPNAKVTASIFIKRYAFLAIIYLYGMTAWNKRLNTSLTNVSIQTDETEDMWLPNFYFHDLNIEAADEKRNEWREKAIKALFFENIHILLERLSKITKQSKWVLWENIAIYVFWLYETVLPKVDVEEVRTRAKEDFHFLIFEASGNLFGYYQENPIKKFFNNKKYNEYLQEEIRVRKTCCFTYLLKGTTNKRCKTCPQTYNVTGRETM